jgi:hypothetical protein
VGVLGDLGDEIDERLVLEFCTTIFREYDTGSENDGDSGDGLKKTTRIGPKQTGREYCVSSVNTI